MARVMNMGAYNQQRLSTTHFINPFFSSVLRVSWNIIESEILAKENFELGNDIEKFYELHQNISLDDLAKKKRVHSKTCLVRVISKVVRYLHEPEMFENYVRRVGQLHQIAGVDKSYLAIAGPSFCKALDSISHHKDLWNNQVKGTWNLLLSMIVRTMVEGYDEKYYLRLVSLTIEQRSLITDVWNMIQDNAVKYLGNTLTLPLIVRSNRSLMKYFTALDSALLGMDLLGTYENSTFDRNKHGTVMLTQVLSRVIPYLDHWPKVEPYLAELGSIHQRHGVKKRDLDLYGLAFCTAIRTVVAASGVKGGPLAETTRAWLTLVQAICWAIKMGYTDHEEEDPIQVEDLDAEEETLPWQHRSQSRASGGSSHSRMFVKRRGVSYTANDEEEEFIKTIRKGWYKSRFLSISCCQTET